MSVWLSYTKPDFKLGGLKVKKLSKIKNKLFSIIEILLMAREGNI